MTRPPGGTIATQPDLGANHEGAGSEEYLSVRTLANQARRIVDDLNLPISGSRVRNLIRQFVRDGRATSDFETYFLGYVDPTGEIAVRRVLRDGRA